MVALDAAHPGTASPAASAPVTLTLPARVPPTHRPPEVPGLVWSPAGTRWHGTAVTYVARGADGVSLLWMDSAVLRFRFIPGTQVPEGSPSLPQDGRPQTWVPRMAAAFNGGFWLRDGAGGYVADGRVVRPLRPGFASLVVMRDGGARVGVWGRDVTLSSGVAVVRQNLRPMVLDGRARTGAHGGPEAWGRPDGGRWAVNRSAVGQLADGSLVYAFGYRVTPQTMASAMVAVGSRTAMMLDMNGSWPMGFVYSHAHGRVTGRRVDPREYHTATVYETRYRKDFVVALLP